MKWILTGIAIGVGIVMMLTIFFPLPVLKNIQNFFLESTIILTAFALLVGLGNLVLVHFLRIARRNEPGTGYSVIVLVSAAIVFVIGLFSNLSDAPMVWIFNNIYLPLQSAFFALTAFFLATAAYRALRARSLETTLMLIAALIVFIGQTPLITSMSDAFVSAKDWVLSVPSAAGVRGILLGVALGTIATGLRVLAGIDRPYSE
ncbi:MAG: hypothetical protein HZB51_08470 [Chloroflexi bacterium]|nr:hypothetical protein [Chloroflexota bacterium]